MSEFKYYNINPLIEEHPSAYYYMVIGERSNGKTHSALDYSLHRFFDSGEQFAYIRRWGEDIRRKNVGNLFGTFIKNGTINKYSRQRYNSVDYIGNRFYLTREESDDKGKPLTIKSEEPIGFAFDLNSMEHIKSMSFPGITTIIFDEFLSRNGYLPNEFILFTNMISTIVRQRDNVKILMLGNTVNMYSPYFAEMGLKHMKDMKQGTVDVYQYANSKLQVVVEYCDDGSKSGGKKSDVYFAFDNPELKMITQGSWEIAIYPHLTSKFKPKDVVAQFFIEFEGEILHGHLVALPDSYPFVFLHRKTTPIQDEIEDIVYCQKPSHLSNRRVGVSCHKDKLSRFLVKCLRESRVFYSENEIGEVFRNYLLWADGISIKN